MIKYRPHRGSLEEAMQEERTFESIDDMKIFVYEEHKRVIGKAPFGLDDIVIGDVLGDDKRIVWRNVRHVCVKRYLDDDYMKEYGSPQCIGWCGE